MVFQFFSMKKCISSWQIHLLKNHWNSDLFQDHVKIIEFQEKLLKFVKMKKIMEKSLNFGSVIHGKITEFWDRHSLNNYMCRWICILHLQYTLVHYSLNMIVRLLVISVFKTNGRPSQICGWVGLWAFLWWAPSAKRKDHYGVSSGWSSVWHRSNTGLSSTQYEQIPIILGVWPFWLTPFFFSPMICQINGALTFFVYYFNCFFLRLIITCRLWVIYVREDNYSNV